MQEIDARGTSTASPDKVWALLADSATWPDWTSIGSHANERPATADDGTGEIRVFTTGRITVREEIVERHPDQRLTYVLLSGLPTVKDYRAEIDLTPSPTGGTDIRWHTTFTAAPILGSLLRRGLAKRTQEFVDGLAAHAAA